jgi:L-threonylcarbamoyladenylate synthase
MLEPRQTKVFNIKNKGQSQKAVSKAAEVLKEGGLVCFPTETVYGLGADAMNDKAVTDLFKAKNRSFENPVALHIHSVEEIPKYVKKINKRAQLLMEKFLPGPLMMVFEKNEKVSDIVSGGLRKVGIRVPRHDICLEFLQECGTPVAATSANMSGRLSCVKAETILEELGGKFDVLLDVGNTPLGIESTVLDVTSDPPRIIRPGFITMEQIAIAMGVPPIISDNTVPKSQDEPTSRQQLKLIVLEGDVSRIITRINSYLKIHAGKKIGIITTTDIAENFTENPYSRKMGPRNDPTAIALEVFEILREMEKLEVDMILMEGIPREGLGRTLMIKLCRLANEVIKLVDQSGDTPENNLQKG